MNAPISLSVSSSTSSLNEEGSPDTSLPTSIGSINTAGQRIYTASAPVISLRNEIGLWQAVCEPSEEILALCKVVKQERDSNVALSNAFTHASWTFDDLRVQTNKLAASLYGNLGACQGRRILLFMPSIPETLLLLLAVSRLGGVAVMCNAEYTGRELQHCIAISQPSAILCLRSDAGKIEALNNLAIRVVQLPSTSSAGMAEETPLSFAEQGVGHLDQLPNPQPASWNDPTLIVFSSGTSGMPKAVQLSHRSLLSVFTLAMSACYFNLSRRETALICMPAHHVGGICTWLMSTIRGDHCLFVPAQKPANFERWTDAILRWRCNKLAATPAIIRALITQGLAAKIAAVKCVTAVNVGAGTLTPWLHTEAERIFACPILNNWGMSELAGGVVRANAYLPSTPGSVGRLAGDVCARIVDEEGNDSKGRGELLVRSPTMMIGYFNNHQATADTIDADGWLHTGDLAYFNGNEELFIVDRLKDLIKYKGWSIAPAELEALLESHAAVVEAAVVGVDAGDGDDGQKPRGFVVVPNVPESTRAALMEELSELVKHNTASYKWLRAGIEIIDQLPRNGNNKVLKRVLRQRYQEALAET